MASRTYASLSDRPLASTRCDHTSPWSSYHYGHYEHRDIYVQCHRTQYIEVSSSTGLSSSTSSHVSLQILASKHQLLSSSATYYALIYKFIGNLLRAYYFGSSDTDIYDATTISHRQNQKLRILDRNGLSTKKKYNNNKAYVYLHHY